MYAIIRKNSDNTGELAQAGQALAEFFGLQD
jgi:hypothetical protein